MARAKVWRRWHVLVHRDAGGSCGPDRRLLVERDTVNDVPGGIEEAPDRLDPSVKLGMVLLHFLEFGRQGR